MEDIYDDLTNYEDVNALEELRTENKELKEMLDKRSAAMEKLQKDYDTIEAEFKKLEHNYSSLLMTARAEIERKTQRINQLNTEKDLMVLNALKSGKRIRRNFSKGQTKYDVLPGKKKENVAKQKEVDKKQERREAPVLPSRVAVPESGTSNKNKPDNAGKEVELSSTRKSNFNENVAQPKTDLNVPLKASASINDRRKSMPAASMPIDTFSSDDELERKYQTKDTRTDHIQSDNERRNIHKIPIDRNSNNTSETSSVDDRVHNYHDPTSSSRDNYKGRPSRQQDTSSYRSRDKYEVSVKYRKQYSPEKGQKRQYREHQDDYHRYDRERYKGRSLESPPPESYSRYNRRKSEHRSDYDRYSHDHEKMRHHYDDKYSSSKYRSKDYDEPHAKRQRTESYGNPNAHSKEDKRHHHERESVDGQPVPCFSPHEYDMLRYSCQSPDFVYTDAGHTNPIKEIRATAAVPLEDPRVTSKKYVIWKDNGKETLSTVAGRNIDIIPVKKAKWNIKPVDIPVALVRPPSQCSDKFIKDIYMDIDNPVTNLDFSMESGEVRETDEIHEIRSKPKEIKHDTHDFKISKQITKDLTKQPTDVNKVPTTNIAEYRIPKVGQNNKNTHSKMDVPIIDLDENLPHHKNANRKSATEDSLPRELLTYKQQYNEREERANIADSLSNNKKYGHKEHIKNPELRAAVDRHKYNEREERVRVEDSIHSSKNYGQKDAQSRKAESLRKELSTHNEREEHVQVEDTVHNSKNYGQKENIINAPSRGAESWRKELSTHKQQYNEREEHLQVEDSIHSSKNYGQKEHITNPQSRGSESWQKALSTHKQQYNKREEHVQVENLLPNDKKYNKIEHTKKSRSRDTENMRKEISTEDLKERVHVKDSVSNSKKHDKLDSNKESTSKEREDSFRKELPTYKQQYNEREERVKVEDSIHSSKNYGQKEHITNAQARGAESSRKELSTDKHQYNEGEERVQVENFLPNNKKYNQIEHTNKSRSRDTEDNLQKEISTEDSKERMHVKDSIPNNKKYSKLESNKTSTPKEREDSFRKELSTHKQQYNDREERVNVKDSLTDNKKYSKLETRNKSTETIANQNQSTLTKIAIVADDLELSDDNSDQDTNRTAPSKSQKNYEKPVNVNEAKINDSGNNADDKAQTSSHSKEIEKTVDTAEITGGTEEEKCKESDSTKKQKTKRKKSKSICKDLVDRADAIHVSEKKSRSKKEKESIPQETKEKFSDLFGDSNSLMTPEDLGIPSYLPISEDAQDAVDIKINQIIDDTRLNYTDEIPKDIHTQNRVEVELQKTEAHDDIFKSVLPKSNTDVDDKEVVTEFKKKSSKRNKENVIEPSQLPSPIVYENLNPGTALNDPNVVKTVIISTGKQPEIAYENSVEVTTPAASVEVNPVQSTQDNIHLFPAIKEYKTDLLKALATSTPHKDFSAVSAPLPDAAKTDVTSDPCVRKAVATITCPEQVVHQTETNTESNDAPDVRIFVKRRRKAVKRPPI